MSSKSKSLVHPAHQPVDFSTLLGHQDQITQLKYLAQNDTLPHALLFCGPPGIGKRRVALALAQLVLSKHRSSGEQLLRAGTHPDLHVVSPPLDKQTISVEAIRELRKALQLKPYMSSRNVAIIHDCEQMTIQAANALLKTLEEPTDSSMLFLVSNADQRLPDTVVSRCQIFYFAELPTDTCHNLLEQICQQAGISPENTSRLSLLVDGSMALLELTSFLDPKTLTFSDLKGLKRHLENLAHETEHLLNIVNSLLAGDKTPKALAPSIASEIAQVKPIPILFWHLLLSALRNEMIKETNQQTPSNDRLESLAQLVEETLATQRGISERNFNPQLQLNSLATKIALSS